MQQRGREWPHGRHGLQRPAYAWLVWRVWRFGWPWVELAKWASPKTELAPFCSESRTTKSPNSFNTATASPGHCNRPPLLFPDLHLERACYRDRCAHQRARASVSLGAPRPTSRLLFNLQQPLAAPTTPQDGIQVSARVQVSGRWRRWRRKVLHYHTAYPEPLRR